jgi:hypothetical protein
MDDRNNSVTKHYIINDTYTMFTNNNGTSALTLMMMIIYNSSLIHKKTHTHKTNTHKTYTHYNSSLIHKKCHTHKKTHTYRPWLLFTLYIHSYTFTNKLIYIIINFIIIYTIIIYTITTIPLHVHH